MTEIINLPCWLTPNDREIAIALLELDWIWLKDEEPESWEDKAWEYKIGRCGSWEFWATPGETSLLTVRNGAVFGLPLEGREPELDFEGELQKARGTIGRVSKAQQARRPEQLSLFEVSHGLR